MELLVPTPAQLAVTLDRGASYWREQGLACESDALPPVYILSAALDEPESSFWLTPRLLVHNREIVGTVTFKAAPGDDGEIEIGYGVAAIHRGHGLAPRAVNLMVAEAFRHPAITSVTAHTALDNAASIRVLEKCGFTPHSRIITEDGETVQKFGIRRAFHTGGLHRA